jgi:uncharacterized protein
VAKKTKGNKKRAGASSNGRWPVRVKSSPVHGRGVFATADIARGQVIEIAPIVVVPEEDWIHLERTTLGGYLYDTGDGRAAVAGGSASFYNHACPANATYLADPEEATVTIEAVRSIRKGDEICINYNGDPDCADPVWFADP